MYKYTLYNIVLKSKNYEIICVFYVISYNLEWNNATREIINKNNNQTIFNMGARSWGSLLTTTK